MAYEHINHVPHVHFHDDVAKFFLKLTSNKIEYENRIWKIDGKESTVREMYKLIRDKFVVDLENYIQYAETMGESHHDRKSSANLILDKLPHSIYQGYIIRELKGLIPYLKANAKV